MVALTLLACAAKTNIGLYVAVLALVLFLRAIDWRRGRGRGRPRRRHLRARAGRVFPWFRAGGFRHWKYDDFGESPREIALSLGGAAGSRGRRSLVDHPQKRRSLLLPLAATGYLGLADPSPWSCSSPTGASGSWPATACAGGATTTACRRWRRRWWARCSARAGCRRPAAPARGCGHYVAACALLSGVFPPYRTPDGDYRSPLYAWRRPRAVSDEDVRTQREAVRFIGQDPRLKVAAQYNLLPHLAGRPYIYELEHARGSGRGGAPARTAETYPDGRPAWRRRVRRSGPQDDSMSRSAGETVVLYRGPEPSVPCPSWEALMAGTEAPLRCRARPER